MQVTAFSGTSVTVTIQHSDDNAAGDPYAAVTGGAFTAVTAVGTQRVQTARNASVKRWLRINLAGTFTTVSLLVMVAKNIGTVEF